MTCSTSINDEVIHPGLTLPVAQLLTSEIPVDRALPLSHIVRTRASLVLPQGSGQCYIRRGLVQPVTVAYQCGCYNSRPAVEEFTVSDDALVEHGIVGGVIY